MGSCSRAAYGMCSCYPCSVFSPPADALCVGCLPLALQLCTHSGSFGFCLLETARRPQERVIIEDRFSLFDSFPSDLMLLHKEVGSPSSCTVKSCSISLLSCSEIDGTHCFTAVVSSVALYVISDPLKPTVTVGGNGNCGVPVSQCESLLISPVLVLEVWSSMVIKVFVGIMAGKHSELHKFSFVTFLCFLFVTQYFVNHPYNNLFYHTFPSH